jgi:serine/threonine-protein kinase
VVAREVAAKRDSLLLASSQSDSASEAAPSPAEPVEEASALVTPEQATSDDTDSDRQAQSTDPSTGDSGRSPEQDAADEERLPFGELALLKELVTRDQLQQLLHVQADRRDRVGRTQKIGTLLVRKGFLSKDEAKRLLRIQRQDGPIDGYRLLEHLGTGGMGAVFRARQNATGREVALKILPPSATRNKRFRARFLREAQVSSRLEHANLVKACDQGESDEHLYMAMELVDGPTAREVTRRTGALPEAEALRYFRHLLQGMHHYWEARILHRDIKPENILIANGQAKLTDLGLCRDLDDDTHLTRVGKTLGTPLYISPELARGQKDIDIRSDLYSLGATVYHLACGVPPFEGCTQGELLQKHVEQAPPAPRLKNPRLSEGLELILLRLLEKSPERRFVDPQAVLEALDRLEAGEVPCELLPPERPTESFFFSDSFSASDDYVVSDSQLSRRAAERVGVSELVDVSDEPNGASVRAELGIPGSSRRRYGSAVYGSARKRGGAYRVGSSPRWQVNQRNLGPLTAVLAFLGLFAVGVFLGSRANSGPARGTTAPAVQLSQRDAFPQLAATDPGRALAEARAYTQRQASDFQGQLFRWQALAERAPASSEAHAVATRALVALQERLEAEAEKAVERLREELIQRVEHEDWGKARGALARFPRKFRGTAAWEQFEELEREVDELAKMTR